MEYKLKSNITKEMLDETKFDVSEWTKEMKVQFQEEMFKLKIMWCGVSEEVEFLNVGYYFANGRYLSYCGYSDSKFFGGCSYKELTWEDLFEEVTNENLVEECLEKVGLSKTPHKSTGGSSKYYEVVLPEWLLDKQKENGYIMIEDLAEIMFDNDFNYTNIFKAQKRMFDLQKGGGKEGNTLEYDANKCKYYVDKQLEVFNRNK